MELKLILKSVFVITVVAVATYFGIEGYIGKLINFGKLYVNNRLIVKTVANHYNVIYIDKNNNRIVYKYVIKKNLNYDSDGKTSYIKNLSKPQLSGKKENIENLKKVLDGGYKLEFESNVFDYFEKDGLLYSIELLSIKGFSLEEYSKKLDENGYVGYYDKIYNNLYVFSHNGTKVNGGVIFYKFKPSEKIKFLNSDIGLEKIFKVEDKTILEEGKFNFDFVNNNGIFEQKNRIFLITCNDYSKKRLVVILK